MCGLEFPDLETAFWQVYAADGLLVVGVNTTDSEDTLQQFVEQTGVTFPVGWDVEESYAAFKAAEDGISPYPLDVVVDRAGKITYLSREYDSGALQAAVEAALADVDPTPPVVGDGGGTTPPPGGGASCAADADCAAKCPAGQTCGCFTTPNGKSGCRVSCPEDGSACPDLKGSPTECKPAGFCGKVAG